MKLTAILLLAAFLQTKAGSYAQTVNIAVKDAPISRVLLDIERQTGYVFFYDASLLKKTKPVTIVLKNVPLEQSLKEILRREGLDYTIENTTITIAKRETGKGLDEAEVSAPAPPFSLDISGKVTDKDGNPLSGATIKVKGMSGGATTDANGNFALHLPADRNLIEISFVGFETRTMEISANNNNLHIILTQSTSQLGEVTVVTALGIGKKVSSLTYSTQQVNNSELTTVKSTNVLNSLNGKIAGVQINRTSSGAGGSVRVVMRGDKSTRNSQPLYVIDGLPVINQIGGATAEWYNGTSDIGDIVSTLNPEDIESINVLKGPSASSLYGSQGSNGVILINTKKGKSGAGRIDLSSGITLDEASILPKEQFTYGQSTAPNATSPGSEDSWGPKGATMPGSGYLKSFYKTGVTWINSVSLTSGNDRSSNYLSYSHTDNSGIVPTGNLKQNSITLRQSQKFLNDKLIIDGSFMGAIQTAHNRVNPGVYFNPLTGLYAFPRGLDFNAYKTFEYFSPSRYLGAQNWWNINTDKGFSGQDYQQNPYWVLNRNPNDNKNQNVYAAASVRYLLNNWLTVQARGNVNNFINEYQRNSYATTQNVLAPDNGLINVNKTNNTTFYGDLLLLGEKRVNADLGISFTAGTSIQDQKGKTTEVRGALAVPNVFMESAIDWSNIARAIFKNTSVSRQIQSVFGTVGLNYKDKFFLDFSDRNDWSSTLAFTPSVKKGYNYYSVGASGVLNKIFSLPAVVDYAKIRVSYAIVGNDIAAFSTYPLYTFNAGVSTPPTSSPLKIPGYYLQPEKNKSFEAGMQWNLLNNRLNLDLTWYTSNITNQYFQNISVSPGLGAGTHADVNGGNIRNRGIEASVSYNVLRSANFSWTTTGNFSHNENKVLELFNSAIVANPSPDQMYALTGGSGFLKQGGSFGDIYGRAFKRDAAGHIIVDNTGMPTFADNIYLGNPNPKTILGWNNAFKIKDFTVNFLIDGKFGGKVMSVTEALLDQMGVSKRTGDARDGDGKIFIPGTVDAAGHATDGVVNAEAYYKAIGGKSPVGEAYMYDATAIRMRELSVSWRAPLKKSIVKDLRISVIGNNLFYFKREAPFDPEQVAGVNPGGVGIEVFGLPSYRSLGLSVKCSF
ncbi:MAG TPA: SusC/RagA family TonB-linked outer membrane protein [Niastella sp.]